MRLASRRRSRGYVLVDALLCALLAAAIAGASLDVLRNTVILASASVGSLSRTSDALSIFNELDSGVSIRLDRYLERWSGSAETSETAGGRRISISFADRNGLQPLLFECMFSRTAR